MICNADLISPQQPVIAWWSGGVTSAVTCKLCINWFGLENVRVVFIDTKNEDDDTYRFLKDCEKWYGLEIEIITSEKYTSIKEVWDKHLSLNVANGAICSTMLKRRVREKFEKSNPFSFQAFGFEITEINRAKSMKMNYPKVKPIFPLIAEIIDKNQAIKIVQDAGLQVPYMYTLGYNNNNCFKTGCVQGGIGYWQKIKREQPEKYDAMALVEHELTDKKGLPVTMLKTQNKLGREHIFLKPHPAYPFAIDLTMVKGREPKPLLECNGFCGINDLSEKNTTEDEINYGESILGNTE